MDSVALFTALSIIGAFLAGGLLGAWLARRGAALRLEHARTLAAADTEHVRARLDERASHLEEQLARSRADHTQAQENLRALNRAGAANVQRIAELETELAATARGAAEHELRLKTLVADTEKRFTDAFQNLAGRILEEKSARFTETNRERLAELLEPFRERLKEFQKRIEDTHLNDTAERRSLKDELKRLMDLNQQVSQDTRKLTTALKGESKTQGIWGEVILERALEMSGLVRGREYDVQTSLKAEDGSRMQPDVIIRLPEGRHLVVDAKCSLVAFERYASASNDDERELALEAHLQSVRTHIRGLGEKNYSALYGVEGLDFVLLFIPVEPAFLAAVQGDATLYETAWRRNIVLVSPTTLMATARVVDSVWRLDRQNRNVIRIAEQAGRMHDAFVLFLKELENATRQVHDASDTLDRAIKRLHTGKGNLIRRADEIRKLGAKASKNLPGPLVELSWEDEGDASPADSEPANADSSPADSSPADSSPADSGPADSGPADSVLAESRFAKSSPGPASALLADPVPDTEPGDAGENDAALDDAPA